MRVRYTIIKSASISQPNALVFLIYFITATAKMRNITVIMLSGVTEKIYLIFTE